MSIPVKLRSALLPTGLPVAQDIYKGNSLRYIVFDFVALPESYYNDEPEQDHYLIQVHLFSRHEDNNIELEKQIKSLLVEAGFSYPSRTPASDEERQHVVFETHGYDYLEVI